MPIGPVLLLLCCGNIYWSGAVFARLTSSNESYSATGRFLIFGSKHRYSGRTEKQAQAEGTNRPPPKVVRTPSKRHQRRSSADSLPNGRWRSSADSLPNGR